MKFRDKKIGVLMGGFSKEREISLKSGRAVSVALQSRGYDVVEIDVGKDIAKRLKEESIDIAFIALHGRFGEDGTIQGLLEVMQIPYTGSGVLSSAIGIDKNLTKKLVSAEGIKTPVSVVILKEDFESFQVSPLPLPVIVKPNCEGSTVGMSIVKRKEEFVRALKEAFSYDTVVLIEEYIEGREVTVGIVEGETLPVLEVVPKSGFYDYEAKYTKGLTDYIVPAKIPKQLTSQLQKESEKIFSTLGLSSLVRIDFMISKKDEVFFLEVNTIPGMTETSLVPKAAAAVGIPFEDLCERILKGSSLKVSEGSRK